MTQPFTTRLHIRHSELDAHGELPNSALFRLFQETAMRATRDAGFGVEWFMERRTVWLVHQMTVEHLHPIRYPDELDVTTWLSDAQKVRTHREYLAHNAATGEIVARGRAYWVHVNGETLLPARIPPALLERFQPNGIRAVPRVEPRAYAHPPNLAPIEQRARRHVQRYEADGLQHVNNAIYIDWLEEALADALLAYLATVPRSTQNARLCVRRHDIEYARPALPGDQVEIVTRRVGAGHCASAWQLEIRRGEELLVRDHLTALWINDAGKPVRW